MLNLVEFKTAYKCEYIEKVRKIWNCLSYYKK